MHNTSELEIRRKLANLYDSLDQAQLIAGDIGLQLARISLSCPMEICWSNIWREAKLQHQALNLIDRVLLDYPSDEQLAHIRHQISQQQEQNPSGEMGTWTSQLDKAEQQSKGTATPSGG